MIGTQEATLVIDAPATVDGDTTTPATLGLVFRKGGRIKFGDHNVRINGPIEAGPYRIFEGTGQVIIADNAVAHLYVGTRSRLRRGQRRRPGHPGRQPRAVVSNERKGWVGRDSRK